MIDNLPIEKRELLFRRLQRAAAINKRDRVPRLERSARSAYPLSFAQQRLWFFHQLAPGNPFYNETFLVRVRGPLEVTVLQQALNELVIRHESLRSVFRFDSGRAPVCVICDPAPLNLELVDLRDVRKSAQSGMVLELAARRSRAPFDLETGPLLRWTLFQASDDECFILIVTHHITSDHWSISILCAEVSALYQTIASGMPSRLPALPVQYVDYAHWQRERLTSEVLARRIAYWRGQLDGSGILDLPVDKPRPPVLTYAGATRTCWLPASLTGELKRLGNEEHASLFMTLVASLGALLHRYTGERRINISCPVSGRELPELEQIVGLFLNTIVIPVEVSSQDTFRDLVRRVREAYLGAHANETPFEKLVEELQPERSLSHTPLLQVMFAFQNIPMESLRIPGLTFTEVRFDSGSAKSDLSFYVEEIDGRLFVHLTYATDLFEEPRMARLLGHWQGILDEVARDAEQQVGEIPFLSLNERAELERWQSGGIAVEQSASVARQFEDAAQQWPDRVALVDGGRQLTYAELNRRANRVAHYLQDLGVGLEDRVGVGLERGLELTVALVGVVKAGAMYVPLDPEYPDERLQWTAADAGFSVLIADDVTRERLCATTARVVCVEEIGKSATGELAWQENPGVRIDAANLMYMIYTSGSTGRPKGVALTHRGVWSVIEWARQTFTAEQLQRTLASTSICFDLSVFEIFVPLSMGASIVIARNLLAARELPEWHQITLINTVPSVMQALLSWGRLPASVRVVNLAGEALKPALVQQVYALGEVDRVLNLYGPTEDTVYSTCAWIGNGRTQGSPIGRPLVNTEVYVLDEAMRPVPAGVRGELYLGGAGLARGYWRRPELTAQRFVPHPFSHRPGERLFRTGDIARWRPDGMLEYLGRADDQVKIRGYRIELGEIEAAMSEAEGVQEAAVATAEEKGGGKRLVAYVVEQPGAHLSVAELRARLQLRLPDYMLPGTIHVVAELYKTANGKVDRKRLAAESGHDDHSGEVWIAPQTAIEELIAGVWAELLGRERISAEANFFDLGGHSLLATQMIARSRVIFGREMPLRWAFEYPMLSQLARQVQRELQGGSGRAVARVERKPKAERRRLSYAQERLWFMDQLEPGNAAYNMAGAIRLVGPISARALEQSLAEVERRHEVLRTHFVFVDGQPMQEAGLAGAVRLPVVDLSGIGAAEREQCARRVTAAQARAPFDLGRGPVWRACLLRLGECEHVAVLVMHHIVGDGWSLGVLARELGALYERYRKGTGPQLVDLEIQYGDYAEWQREWLERGELERQLGYWKQELTGAPEEVALPWDRPRPLVASYRGGSVELELDGELSEALRAFNQREGVTMFMSVLAAFVVLLHRYSGQPDLIVGTDIANRTSLDTEALIGFFVNQLALRVKLEPTDTFRDLIERVRDTSLRAYGHQDLPFEKLVQELAPGRHLAKSPLFQVKLVVQNTPPVVPSFELARISGFPVENEFAQFDLTLVCSQREDRVVTALHYSADLFERLSIERMSKHFRNILRGAIQDAGRRVGELNLLTDAEFDLLRKWGNVGCSSPPAAVVHELLARQAANTRDRIAIVTENQQLSYGELNRRTNQLAWYLRKLGAGLETRVAICLNRSADFMISLFGVLKAGAAYVPLDPAYPQERLSLICNDASAPILLTHSSLDQRLPSGWMHIVRLDQVWNEIGGECSSDPDWPVDPSNLAYIIYTSGSTGRPKGICITHAGVCHLAAGLTQAYDVTLDDTMLQFSSFSFDAATTEWGISLLNGGRLAMADRDALLPGPRLTNLLRSLPVTVVTFPPSVLALLPCENFPALRTLAVSAEACPPSLVKQWGPNRRMINAYGPTEITVCATVSDPLAGEAKPDIGRPIQRAEALVLNELGSPVPVGVPGELYLGGAGVARGYINQPELTAEKFVPHPFRADGERLYRTGDLVRWLSDGRLDFIGRLDRQVKIRGCRVEPDEVSVTLSRHGGVRQNAVMARTDDGGRAHLVAYVAADPGVTASELRDFLRQTLSEYMMPERFAMLDTLPLTPNGKVDFAALGDPVSEPAAVQSRIRPISPSQEAAANVWKEALGVTEVFINDDFFDLGGHSLVAAQVVVRVRQVFQCDISVRALFEHPTLEAFVAHIEKMSRGPRMHDVPIPALAATTSELSFAQQRLWFLDQLEPGSPVYNIPQALRLEGDLRIGVLRRVLSAIVARHESLRTRFELRDGEPWQVISDDSAVSLPVADLSELAEGQRADATRRVAEMEAARPFDLSRGGLMRALVLRLAARDHVVLFTMHHIVSDGWSMGVLIREVSALYAAHVRGEAPDLPELPIQYADYAQWQRKWMGGEILRCQEEYWKKTLAGAPPLLELPWDHPRPSQQDFTGAFVPLVLDEELTAGTRDLSKRHGATLCMTFLATWAALLARLSGQSDIVIGMPVANRGRSEIEELIGFFVNTLAIRVDVSGVPSVGELLDRVRAQSLSAQEQQDIPFEQVVEIMAPVRSLAHTPVFQVMFAWQDAPEGKLELPGVAVQTLNSVARVAKFDLTLTLWEVGGNIVGGLEYAISLFERSTIERFIEYLRALLQATVADETQAVDRLPLLPEPERQRVLYEWNRTDAGYPAGGTYIHELFEQQAEQCPHAVALVFEDAALSYGELNRQANRRAHYLRGLGVKPDAPVAVFVERGFEMVVALLAVLKAGGVYVPLDPDHPAERLRFTMQDVGAVALLTQGDLQGLFAGALRENLAVVDLKSVTPAWQRQPATNPDRTGMGLTSKHLAYAIYTSGSTGVPKGVMVEHSSLVNTLVSTRLQLQLTSDDRIAFVSGQAFDISLWELLTILTVGGAVEIWNRDDGLESSGTKALLRGVTVLHAVPGLMRKIASDIREQRLSARVRIVLTGGDTVPPDLIEEMAQAFPGASVWILYGPTETAILATGRNCAWQSHAPGKLLIGRPFANTRVYILDANQEPAPVGVPGELYISGVGVARGYLNHPELTAERFMPNPFMDGVGARMYRSGDLGRWLEDGTIEFLGRNDFQVKIRGFRIELGEVEAALCEHAQVGEAVVSVGDDSIGQKRLVAYVTPRGDAVGSTELRRHLGQRLPGYMIPSAFVMLDQLPLTPTGKVDRSALAASGARLDLESHHEPPANAVEQVLVEIWEQVLGTEQIGVHDNFFDLGGHSLLATHLVSKVEEIFGRRVALRALFQTPSVRGLAEELRRLWDGAETIEQIAEIYQYVQRSDGVLPKALPTHV